MKNHDLAALLRRAAAAIETPKDLTTEEFDHLVADLTFAADEVFRPAAEFTGPLYKTTAVIWSEFDPSGKIELSDLARRAEVDDCYCSKQVTELVKEPTKDPNWDGTEFFANYDDEGNPDPEEVVEAKITEKGEEALDRWKSDEIQFPRLLAELRAVGLTDGMYEELCASMDIEKDDLDELLERAETAWQKVVQKL